MVGPKSLTSALQDLRPKDSSSAAIAASLRQLAVVKSSDAAEIVRLEEARPRMLLSASPAEIDHADQTVRHLRIRAEQLDAMAPELNRMLGEARLREEDEEYKQKLSEVEAKAAAWNERFLEQYPAWYASIQPLFKEEMALEDEIKQVTQMRGAQRAHPDARNMFFASRIMVRHGSSEFSQGVRWGHAILLPQIPEGTR